MKREEYDFTSALVRNVKGLRIGLPKDSSEKGLDSEVKAAILRQQKLLSVWELL